ncbi:MAG: roadblock/LC7 domain-containing protein [Desulfuromonadales bacterium]|nr:roadblock/LC7 domain-containing protein [Desulfuromonadales bacterium]
MQDILRYINSVEGVIGSAVFNDRGAVMVHAFPPIIDANSIKAAAGLTLECVHGLQIAQTLDILDLRYAEGRIIVKSFPGGLLYLLCTKNINLQVLTITINLAVKKLEVLLPNAVEPEATAAEEAVDSSILRLSISHLANQDASNSFDSLGMIAVSQPTSSYIGEFYKTAFKKLILTNTAAGTSGTFPVMVMKDLDPQYDGTIIVGPGIEKKLQVSEGDKVEIRIG